MARVVWVRLGMQFFCEMETIHSTWFKEGKEAVEHGVLS
jgi:hypothetical protein